MKIRFRDDSVRLRLTQRETVELAGSGRVTATTKFGGGQNLVFEVRACNGAAHATFRDGVVCVEVPATAVREWAAGPQIMLSATYQFEDGEFRISVEKDLECRKPRPYEDNSDAFPASLGAPHCA